MITKWKKELDSGKNCSKQEELIFKEDRTATSAGCMTLDQKTIEKWKFCIPIPHRYSSIMMPCPAIRCLWTGLTS